MFFRIGMLLFVATLWVTTAQAADTTRRVFEVAPGQNYRQLLQQLKPGDELVFLPGVHEAAMVVQTSGTAEQPITIRGKMEDGKRPELRFTGRGHNLWRIEASHLVVKDLGFHATHAYGIRIGEAKNITIENCHFRDCGGGDISANTGNVDGLTIRGCRFTGTRLTPLYIGNHQGKLEIRNFVFERNFIDGSQIEDAPNTVGYVIQLKLNVRGGVIRENWITGALGPGIMVYGAEGMNPADASVIERNVVIGSRDNAGIIVGGGPAIVKNNVVLGCKAGGISIFNYNKRNMLDRIELIDNLAVANMPFDFNFDRPVTHLTAQGNRAWTLEGMAAPFRRLPEGENVKDNETSLVEWNEKWVDRIFMPQPEAKQFVPFLEGLKEMPQTSEELFRRLLNAAAPTVETTSVPD